MAQPIQKIIITTVVNKEGNIDIKKDFWPHMPTQEEYQQMSEGRRATVAVINQLSNALDIIVKKMSEIKEPVAPIEAA